MLDVALIQVADVNPAIDAGAGAGFGGPYASDPDVAANPDGDLAAAALGLQRYLVEEDGTGSALDLHRDFRGALA